jgi:hypothetical protein
MVQGRNITVLMTSGKCGSDTLKCWTRGIHKLRIGKREREFPIQREDDIQHSLAISELSAHAESRIGGAIDIVS